MRHKTLEGRLDVLQCTTRWYATCLCIRMRPLSSKDKLCAKLHKFAAACC